MLFIIQPREIVLALFPHHIGGTKMIFLFKTYEVGYNLDTENYMQTVRQLEFD